MSSTNQPDSIDVRIENGLIVFDGYELYKQRAEEAREYLMSLEINADTEQECKRTVAAARKISDKLNQDRISIKKAILAPYNAYEEKVKEIVGIITEGENVARDKLKALDDQRREEKKAEIQRLWDLRANCYECWELMSLDDFLVERHLNKTVPISEVEKELIAFLVKTNSDLMYLRNKPLAEEYIAEYKHCKDGLKAMDIVDRRHSAAKAVAKDPYMTIRITGKADIVLAKQLLKDVNYKIMEEK